MPVIQRRPVVLAQKQNTSPRNSADSDDTLREHIIILGDDYEKPQKEMDFPSAKLVHISNNKMKNSLRINTQPKTELHERYMSSEVCCLVRIPAPFTWRFMASKPCLGGSPFGDTSCGLIY